MKSWSENTIKQRLLVPAPPVFVRVPADQKVGLNGIATFACSSKGNPVPSVFWTKEGSQVLMFAGNTYGHFHVLHDGTLKIQGAQREDTGFLICSALSVAGSTSVRAFLQVNIYVFFKLLLSTHYIILYILMTELLLYFKNFSKFIQTFMKCHKISFLHDKNLALVIVNLPRKKIFIESEYDEK